MIGLENCLKYCIINWESKARLLRHFSELSRFWPFHHTRCYRIWVVLSGPFRIFCWYSPYVTDCHWYKQGFFFSDFFFRFTCYSFSFFHSLLRTFYFFFLSFFYVLSIPYITFHYILGVVFKHPLVEIGFFLENRKIHTDFLFHYPIFLSVLRIWRIHPTNSLLFLFSSFLQYSFQQD